MEPSGVQDIEMFIIKKPDNNTQFIHHNCTVKNAVKIHRRLSDFEKLVIIDEIIDTIIKV